MSSVGDLVGGRYRLGKRLGGEEGIGVFAAGVHRDEVYAGAELLGLELDEHIRNVVAALQPIGPELGLRTAADG